MASAFLMFVLFRGIKMKINNIRKLSILLVFTIVFSIVLCTSFNNKSYAEENSIKIEKALSETMEYIIKNKDSFSDAWPIIGIVRSGSRKIDNISKSYVSTLKKELREKNGVLTISKYSDYSKAILALTALGIDPRNVNGYNLIDNLSDMDKITIQGINGPLWALLAIDSNNYNSPISRQKLIDYILKNEIDGGGWALSSEISDVADVDITAMVLTSLSKDKNEVIIKPYVERGLEFLSKAQKSDGGFETLSVSNSESSSQVIIALSSLQIDPIKDARFIKNSHNVIDNLINNYYKENGGFSHIKNSKVDKIATEQAFNALVSYSRFKEQKLSLFNMTDITINIDEKEEDVVKPFKNPFIDIENDSEKMAIINLSNDNIIKGVTETEFQPNKNISRAEFAALITRALKVEENQEHGFIDVNQSEWFSGYVGAAKTASLINGYPDNTFKPDANITRQEAAVIIFNMAKMKGLDISMGETEVRNYLSQFPDYLNIGDWSLSAVGFGVKKGYIPNQIINIEPKKEATRSEIAGMLYRLLQDI